MNNVKTTITWCDFTWNPVTGCLRGCDYCYARQLAQRLAGRAKYPKDDPFQPLLHEDRFQEPIKMKKPARIFVCSMGELWGPWVPTRWQELVLQVTEACPQHRFLFLTHNRQGYASLLDDSIRDSIGDPGQWQNCWWGVTITEGELHNHGGPPGRRFVSFEPILGPVSLGLDRIDWAILGGLIRPRVERPEPRWVTDLVAQLDRAAVPVFVKKNLGQTGVDLDPELLSRQERPADLRWEGET